jgi:MFS family permease
MGNPSSSFLGLLVSVVFVGGFVGAFIAPPVSDRYGRRVCIFAGSTLCIIGTVLQSASQEREMFLVGRVIIGLGISFTTCGGPTLVNELSHPALRGKISSMVRFSHDRG